MSDESESVNSVEWADLTFGILITLPFYIYIVIPAVAKSAE